MTITHWTVFWVTELDNISSMFDALGLLFLITALFFVIAANSEAVEFKDNLSEKYFRNSRKFFIIGLLLMSFNSLLPSTKQMAAVYIIPAVVNNQNMQKVPSNLAKLINVSAESYINEELGLDKTQKKEK